MYVIELITLINYHIAIKEASGLRLLAGLFHTQGVGGSSPPSPTIFQSNTDTGLLFGGMPPEQQLLCWLRQLRKVINLKNSPPGITQDSGK